MKGQCDFFKGNVCYTPFFVFSSLLYNFREQELLQWGERRGGREGEKGKMARKDEQEIRESSKIFAQAAPSQSPIFFFFFFFFLAAPRSIWDLGSLTRD